MNLPWAPVLSVERSGVPEVVIYGALSVVEGRPNSAKTNSLLSVGDISFELWTRSLLKPWQFLAHLDIVRAAYPSLKDHHLALMMASHSAEPEHQRFLNEIMDLTGVGEDKLKCPATYPYAHDIRHKLKEEGAPARRLYHNCSGKHLGYLAAIKHRGGNMDAYLEPEGPQFTPTLQILNALTQRTSKSLPVTVDGCQLPNYALTVRQMSDLYCGLATAESTSDRIAESLQPPGFSVKSYCLIRDLMSQNPTMIGGTDRLDTKIMSGLLGLRGAPVVVAKEGADGMLAIGVGPTADYPGGLGVLIKLSSGFDDKYMQLLAGEIFAQLGLRPHDSDVPSQPKGTRTDHLRYKFPFQIGVKQNA